MAGLEDFFAKKDKRKGKKKKYTSSSTIAQGIEAQSQPVEDDAAKDVKIDIPNAPTQDSEWKEEEKLVQDLEGLKVQSMTQSEELTERQVHEDDIEGDEDEMNPKPALSPWQQLETSPTQELPQPVEKPPPPPSGRSTYVPPNLRQQQMQHLRPGRKLDIHSDQAFPSLLSTTQRDKAKERSLPGDFQEVRSHRGRAAADSTYSSPNLELTNKYDTLQDN